MKIAVIGSSGQLGHDLMRILPAAGLEVIGFSGRLELDIANAAAVEAMLESHRPDAVINTAAFHNVDLCESRPDDAWKINAVAVRDAAQACQKRKIVWVQIGTDYVAEGWPACRPIAETAAVWPKSIYATSRFAGDCLTLAHAPQYGYVVRTCGLFGMAGCKLKGGLNFVDTMIAAAKAGKPLRVVSDQIVAPTATDTLSRQLAALLEHLPGPGLYHAVSHGQCSWHEFAQTALKMAGLTATVEPVTSSAFAAAAIRPRYSVLDNARLRAVGLDLMEDWPKSLQRYIAGKYPPPA
ncbi:MAG: dTDP-4-dehydrorhamnose reductase [Phycisphaerae bacterium]|nr:dTDP-4-dehydrorhamnose reductase [Phycisphaerae bacterium]